RDVVGDAELDRRERHRVANVQRLLDQEDQRQQDQEAHDREDGERRQGLPVEAQAPPSVVPTGGPKARSGGTSFQQLAANRGKKVPPLRLASLGFGRDDGQGKLSARRRRCGSTPWRRTDGPSRSRSSRPA